MFESDTKGVQEASPRTQDNRFKVMAFVIQTRSNGEILKSGSRATPSRVGLLLIP